MWALGKNKVLVQTWESGCFVIDIEDGSSEIWKCALKDESIH